MASGGQQYDTHRLIAIVKGFRIRELKPILKDLDLPVSGKVAALQERLVEKIRDTAIRGDTIGYNRVKKLVSPDSPTFLSHVTPPNPRGNQSTFNSSRLSRPSPLSGTGSYGTYSSQHPAMPPLPAQWPSGHLSFKESPFYEVLEALSQVLECKVRETTRDTLVVKLPLHDRVIQRLQADPNIRVMLFGAADNTGSNPFYNNDIAFPHQVELKVNLDEVKVNLRGLKNKPGTTRPADITSYLRKVTKYENEIRLTYALTHKKFFIIVNLVRKIEPQELLGRLQAGKAISKDQVLREMNSKAQDPDITTTSSVMSLKCPLSTLRIQVPCRTDVCSHNQCFDASAFLQLQEQAPTWTCPICNKGPVTFGRLQIDKYVEGILMSTKLSVEQVTVEPDGTWSENVAADTSFPPSRATAFSPGDGDGDDDLVEIQDIRVNALKQEAGSQGSPQHRTPPASSREQSTASSRPSSNKRPSNAIIDLTLSDDEELAVPPPKRPSYDLSSTSASLPHRNGGGEPTSGPDANTVPGGITFGIPNNIGRQFYQANGYLS